MRRLVQAAHVLRLDAQDERERRPQPGLRPLQDGIDEILEEVEASLGARPQQEPHAARASRHPRTLRDLRRRESGQDDDALALLAELDEIVDAANGLAAAAGLEGADDGRPARGRRR